MALPTLHESPPATPPVRPERLISWKEIAAWFDRDVRTVQLWEKHERLPVHRHGHSARSTVYALTAELDLWFAARRRRPNSLNSPETFSARLAARLAPLFPHPALRITVAVGMVLALAVSATVAWRSHHKSPPPASALAARPTLAVLPLEDLSPGPGSGLWVDGLTDDLITDLGRYSSLDVISHRSSNQFRNTQQSLPAIASQLHANLILEGTIASQGGQTRITVQLVDAARDHLLWSARYVRATKDILSLQDDLARQITAELTEKVTGVRPTIGTANISPICATSTRHSSNSAARRRSIRSPTSLPATSPMPASTPVGIRMPSRFSSAPCNATPPSPLLTTTSQPLTSAPANSISPTSRPTSSSNSPETTAKSGLSR